MLLHFVLALDTVPSHPESIFYSCSTLVYISELPISLASLTSKHTIGTYLQVNIRRLEYLKFGFVFKGSDSLL